MLAIEILEIDLLKLCYEAQKKGVERCDIINIFERLLSEYKDKKNAPQ